MSADQIEATFQHLRRRNPNPARALVNLTWLGRVTAWLPTNTPPKLTSARPGSFIEGDACRLRLPDSDGAAAFWCMISIPDYEIALENVASSLAAGGSLAVLDSKRISGRTGLLINPLFDSLCRLTYQDIDREPWVYMRELLEDVQTHVWPLGGLLADVYLAHGRKGSRSTRCCS